MSTTKFRVTPLLVVTRTVAFAAILGGIVYALLGGWGAAVMGGAFGSVIGLISLWVTKETSTRPQASRSFRTGGLLNAGGARDGKPTVPGTA